VVPSDVTPSDVIPSDVIPRDVIPSDVIDEHVTAAQEALSQALGSSSLCDIGRAGQGAPAVKRAEGAWVALRDVRAAARRGSDTAAAVDEIALQWQEDLALRRQRGASQEWLAYLEGGLEALERLRLALSE
jgi:hypothetical protein